MRIACVHVPQFALQCLCRLDLSLRGAAVAVVGAGFDAAVGVRPSLALHSPIVLACSRAAWTLGVRLGMTASAARFVSPELRVVAADAQLERETVRAIADGLLGLSTIVDSGGRVGGGGAHLAMYCEVPSKTRGTTFGGRLLDLLDTLGLAARIGIADDRFTAWVAAAHGAEGSASRERAGAPRDGAVARDGADVARDGADVARDGAGEPDDAAGAIKEGARAAREDRGVVIVPRGGSAAFLAPRPLSLLAITAEVQHMLEALGVTTLGEFAALPAPSVARPLEADYQALARGDSGSALRPYAPEAPIREELAVAGTGGLFAGATAVAALAERIALRLAGRARGAARLEVTLSGRGGERMIAVAADPPASTQYELVDALAPVIGEALGTTARLRVVVVGEAIAGAAADERAAPRGTRAEARGRAEVMASSGASAGSSRARTEVADVDEAELGDLAPVVSMAHPGHAPPWQLTAQQALRSERRDAHRRTRRARSRRRTVAIAQSQLFGNR